MVGAATTTHPAKMLPTQRRIKLSEKINTTLATYLPSVKTFFLLFNFSLPMARCLEVEDESVLELIHQMLKMFVDIFAAFSRSSRRP